MTWANDETRGKVQQVFREAEMMNRIELELMRREVRVQSPRGGR